MNQKCNALLITLFFIILIFLLPIFFRKNIRENLENEKIDEGKKILNKILSKDLKSESITKSVTTTKPPLKYLPPANSVSYSGVVYKLNNPFCIKLSNLGINPKYSNKKGKNTQNYILKNFDSYKSYFAQVRLVNTIEDAGFIGIKSKCTKSPCLVINTKNDAYFELINIAYKLSSSFPPTFDPVEVDRNCCNEKEKILPTWGKCGPYAYQITYNNKEFSINDNLCVPVKSLVENKEGPMPWQNFWPWNANAIVRVQLTGNIKEAFAKNNPKATKNKITVADNKTAYFKFWTLVPNVNEQCCASDPYNTPDWAYTQNKCPRPDCKNPMNDVKFSNGAQNSYCESTNKCRKDFGLNYRLATPEQVRKATEKCNLNTYAYGRMSNNRFSVPAWKSRGLNKWWNMPYVGGNQGQFCIKGNAPDDKCPPCNVKFSGGSYGSTNDSDRKCKQDFGNDYSLATPDQVRKATEECNLNTYAYGKMTNNRYSVPIWKSRGLNNWWNITGGNQGQFCARKSP